MSVTYVLDDDKERVRLGEKMTENQLKMYVMTKQLHQMQEKKERINLIKEIEAKPYKVVKQKAVNNMNMELAAIISGKTKEELKEKAKQP